MTGSTKFAELFPYTTIFLRWTVKLRWVWLAGFVSLVLLVVALHLWNRHRLLRAESVSGLLDRVVIGQSTAEEVSEWVDEAFPDANWSWEDRRRIEFGYLSIPETTLVGTGIRNYTTFDVLSNLFSLVGLRTWRVIAAVSFRNGAAIETNFLLMFRSQDGSWRAYELSEGSRGEWFHESSEVERNAYSLQRPNWKVGGGGIMLRSWLGSSASDEAKENARGIRFSCLDPFSDCVEVCDLVPGAWLDFVTHFRNQSFGEKWIDNPASCQKVMAGFKPVPALRPNPQE